jgi:DNA invertase Pin-like site-specific DNA recombinase
MSSPAIAYSYIRFSTPEQAQGDSLRRQSELAENWCKRNKVALDRTTTFRDLGRSAFAGDHRKNPDRHALARFLKLVEEGRVPRGSYLIIENLDRLSREHIRPALTLLLQLIDAGVRVVQMSPVEQVFDDKVEPMMLMMAIMELSRGHNESAIKSRRVGAAWSNRRKAAREKGETLTRRFPAWVEEVDGERRLIPERANVVKRIFEMSIAGHGLFAIMTWLNDNNVPPFGTSGKWHISYIDLILKDRRAIGELTPARCKGPNDEPIPNYFPAVVDEDTWQRARLGAKTRHRTPGRSTANVNVFKGMLRDARTGEVYVCGKQKGGTDGDACRVIRSNAIRSGDGSTHSFPLVTFELAVLGMLREVDPRELLPPSEEADESLALSTQYEAIKGRIEGIEAELLDGGDSAALARVLRGLEAKLKDVGERLAVARQKAASPLSEAWGEAKTLLSALDAAADRQDARTRLRSALLRVVDAFWILVVKRGRRRLCAVQVHFRDSDRRRSYLILHQPVRANADTRDAAGWWARSLTADELPSLDLRIPEHVQALERQLQALDLATLTKCTPAQ